MIHLEIDKRQEQSEKNSKEKRWWKTIVRSLVIRLAMHYLPALWQFLIDILSD